MEKAGLRDVFVKINRINLQEESGGMLKRYGCGGMLSVMGRMLKLYFGNPAYRKFVKEIRQEGVIPPHLEEYFGYGIYIGRK